jgi:hypothetical protein
MTTKKPAVSLAAILAFDTLIDRQHPGSPPPRPSPATSSLASDGQPGP